MEKIIVFICVVAFVIIMHFINVTLQIKKYVVESPNLPISFQGLRIVMLADLHNNSFGKNNSKLIDTIKKLNPDYVMIAGDLIIGKQDFLQESTMHLLRELSKHYEIFYAPGNHEQKLSLLPEIKDSTYEEYINEIKNMGIHFMENQSYEIERNKEKICVSGLSMDRPFYNKEWKHVSMEENYINHLIGKPKKDMYQILIAHQPKYFRQYASWGADLVLSGHNHGGIIIFPKLGGLISPSFQFFPEFDYGAFKIEKATMILSKGLGLHTIKLRIGHFPEVSVIDLKNLANCSNN